MDLAQAVQANYLPESSRMSKASFQTSPLTEVICGITFDAPDFASVHFGLYWQSIQARYPSLPKDTQPIGEMPLLAIPPKLRRVWFESIDQAKVVQLQSDKFLYNWRKVSQTVEYPHFQDVYQGFSVEWQHFEDWWRQLWQAQQLAPTFPGLDPIKTTQYELTYLNQIGHEQGWDSSADTQRIFKFLAGNWSGFPLSQPQAHQFNLEFALPEGMGTLSISISQGIELESNLPVLICELTARSANTQLPIDHWFEAAHESMVQSFLHILNEDVKTAWGFTWLAP